MATGTRGNEDTLYFCHENDHSCYRDNQGNLFGEGDDSGVDLSSKEGLSAYLQQMLDRLGKHQRPPERIVTFMETLQAYWTSHPNLRFGQLVRNLRLDEYNREDGDSLTLIENQIDWDRQSKD